MIRATDVHSVTDFTRNTKAFIEKLKESKNPMVLTVNGDAEIVVQDAASYQAMLDELEVARINSGIQRAIEQDDQGLSTPAILKFAEMKAKYDL